VADDVTGATCSIGEGVLITTQTATGTGPSLQFYGGNFPNNYAAGPCIIFGSTRSRGRASCHDG
jgi:hypothetical protein